MKERKRVKWWIHNANDFMCLGVDDDEGKVFWKRLGGKCAPPPPEKDEKKGAAMAGGGGENGGDKSSGGKDAGDTNRPAILKKMDDMVARCEKRARMHSAEQGGGGLKIPGSRS